MSDLKKIIACLVLIVSIFYFSSCATIFGGPITTYQKTKPSPGEPKREIRPVPFILDIITLYGIIGLVVDFADGAIYKPNNNMNNNRSQPQQNFQQPKQPTQSNDVVYLKDGGILHGTIIEQIPDVSVKIQTNLGNVLTFKMSEVQKIEKGGQ
jgi:hypothetical protein